MPRKLTTGQARKMVAKRKTFRGGRPKVPTACPKCGAMCEGERQSRVHC